MNTSQISHIRIWIVDEHGAPVIYCFDVSKQEMTLGSNNATCDLHVHFKAGADANLGVYITWLSDRTLEMFTDGSPINIRKQVDNYK